MKQKIVLVTGVTGQDGSYLVEKLTKEPNTFVYGLTRRTARGDLGALNHHTCKPNWENFSLIQGDLTDSISIRSVFNKIDSETGDFPNEIYHMGAFTHVGQSYNHPELCMTTNFNGTLNLLEAIKEYNPETYFYNAATSELFSGIKGTTPQNENTPMEPRTPYGISKLAAFNLCNFYRNQYGLYISQGILFNHGSPRRGSDFVEMKIVRGLTKIALGLQDNLILGNIDAKRDWGFAPDYMDAIVLINRSQQFMKSDNYIIGTGQVRTVKDLVKTVSDILVNICESKIIPEEKVQSNHPDLLRGNEVHELQADIKKTVKKLGWLPSTSFEQMLKVMVQSELFSLQKENLEASIMIKNIENSLSC